MESPEKATVNEMPKAPSQNERSTIEFPYSDLDSSVEVVRGVHEVGGTACEYDQLAAHMKLEAKGGGFRIRVTSAKAYGLLTYERGGRITLTDLGRKLLDPHHERQARVGAFLKVPLYQKVFDTFKGSPLPPKAGLERTIIGFGVGAKVADKARQVMLRSAKQAGFFELGQDRLTAPPIRKEHHGQQNSEVQSDQNRQGGKTPPGGGGGGSDHPLIQGLFMTLPEPNSTWTLRDRQNWLVMANSIFKMIYPSDTEGDVVISVHTHE